MPIYEFYCPDNHRIYQFYARTLAQGGVVPKCPENPRFRMQKMLSSFAVTGAGRPGEGEAGAGGDDGPREDPRIEAAMGQMEHEFSSVDENDPRAMGRMMRRMADLTGEPIAGEMEEVVRKLEEGADPESLEEQLGAADPAGEPGGEPGAPRTGARRARVRRAAPVRDPQLYEYT
jgi:hypothetical protein